MSAERGHKLTLKLIEAKGETPAYWKTRVTIGKPPNTSRPWVTLDFRQGESEEKLRQRALNWAEKQTKAGVTTEPRKGSVRAKATPEGETVSAYAVRWFAERTKRGYTSVRSDLGRFKNWIEPVIGALPIATVRRLDVERLVEHLDAKVQAEELHWKSAQNAWGLVTKMFDDARRSKVLALRARDDNPAADVRGPDRGTVKAKTFVYPSEFDVLMQCEDVPETWRRIFAVTLYLYLRAAELRGLKWEDVDVEHLRVLVHRTVDKSGAESSTKGDVARPVAIEPTLAPLLQSMRDESGGVGFVFPDMPRENLLAETLRGYLARAGVARAELFKTNKTRRQLRYHDLRASGITWRAVRGDDALKIMQAAGHTEFATTMGYVRTADQVRGGFGDVFGPLPESVIGASMRPAMRPKVAKSAKPKCEERDLNPGRGSADGDCAENRTGEDPAARAEPEQVREPSTEVASRNLQPDASGRMVFGDLDAAIRRAVEHDQWELAMVLAAELKARRLADAGVPSLVDRRAKRS